MAGTISAGQVESVLLLKGIAPFQDARHFYTLIRNKDKHWQMDVEKQAGQFSAEEFNEARESMANLSFSVRTRQTIFSLIGLTKIFNVQTIWS